MTIKIGNAPCSWGVEFAGAVRPLHGFYCEARRPLPRSLRDNLGRLRAKVLLQVAAVEGKTRATNKGRGLASSGEKGEGLWTLLKYRDCRNTCGIRSAAIGSRFAAAQIKTTQ